MSYCISLVTWNRCAILERVLDGIAATCAEEHPTVLCMDNGSTDGTPAMLREREARGELRAWLLPENVGIAKARNAHWGECVGHDVVRMDDKALPLTAGWLTVLKRQSEWWHACIGTPYDPTVQVLWLYEPLYDFVEWNQAGEGGPVLFVPAVLTEALGAFDELPGVLYGWEDVLFNHRARLLGWRYGFSLRAKFEMLASASPATRLRALDHHAAYMERRREYEEGLRDVFIPVETKR